MTPRPAAGSFRSLQIDASEHFRFRVGPRFRFDVVGFGFNTVDHVCIPARPPGYDSKSRLRQYEIQPGGQVPTALVALQRWGAITAYVGPFGGDEPGREQQRSLAAEGIDLTGSRLRPDIPSQTSIIMIDSVTGERTILWHRESALALRPEELDLTTLTAGQVLFLDADDTETALLAASRASELGCAVVLDVDDPGPKTRELFQLTDVAIVSASFPSRMTGIDDLRTALREMQQLGPPIVVATLGAGGVMTCVAGELRYYPALPTRVLDTTAAGDLFHAGFIQGMLQSWSVDTTIRFATAAAALECESIGGRSGIPSLAAVRQRLAASK